MRTFSIIGVLAVVLGAALNTATAGQMEMIIGRVTCSAYTPRNEVMRMGVYAGGTFQADDRGMSVGISTVIVKGADAVDVCTEIISELNDATEKVDCLIGPQGGGRFEEGTFSGGFQFVCRGNRGRLLRSLESLFATFFEAVGNFDLITTQSGLRMGRRVPISQRPASKRAMPQKKRIPE